MHGHGCRYSKRYMVAHRGVEQQHQCHCSGRHNSSSGAGGVHRLPSRRQPVQSQLGTFLEESHHRDGRVLLRCDICGGTGDKGCGIRTHRQQHGLSAQQSLECVGCCHRLGVGSEPASAASAHPQLVDCTDRESPSPSPHDNQAPGPAKDCGISRSVGDRFDECYGSAGVCLGALQYCGAAVLARSVPREVPHHPVPCQDAERLSICCRSLLAGLSRGGCFGSREIQMHGRYQYSR